MPRSRLLCLATALTALTLGCAQAGPAKPTIPPNPRNLAPATIDPELDAVRGCWIQKTEPNGRATLLLRLLPDREHKDWLSGQLQHADGDDPDRRLQLWFSRDGRTALMATKPLTDPAPAPATAPSAERQMPKAKAFKPGADAMASLVHNPSGRIELIREPNTTTPPKGAEPGTRVVEFRQQGGSKRLRVEVSAEWLKLSVGTLSLPSNGTKQSEAVLFDGGRDGCD